MEGRVGCWCDIAPGICTKTTGSSGRKDIITWLEKLNMEGRTGALRGTHRISNLPVKEPFLKGKTPRSMEL